jgi:hypothetical protein
MYPHSRERAGGHDIDRLLKHAKSCNQQTTIYSVVTVEETATRMRMITATTTAMLNKATPIEGHVSQIPEELL